MHKVYLEGRRIPFTPVFEGVIKQIYKNEDGGKYIIEVMASCFKVYLEGLDSSSLTLTNDQITTIYHKRWKVERYHQSLKMNAGLCKSPSKK